MKNVADDRALIIDEIQRLEAVVLQIGEVVLATTETLEYLVERIDAIAVQMKNQEQQLQQQTYQIFTLNETLQDFMKGQVDANEKLENLTNRLKDLRE